MFATCCSRAAQFFLGFLPQTPSLSLTQTVTPYQFLGPYGIILPRHESFEVDHFEANIKMKWPTLTLLGRGKTMSLGPQKWCGVTVWVKLNDGV